MSGSGSWTKKSSKWPGKTRRPFVYKAFPASVRSRSRPWSIIGTALVAGLGDATQFKRGREVSAFLGLTPRQYSSGGKERLSGIGKRGDSYLRTLLIHGARSALKVVRNKGNPRRRWAVKISQRRHKDIGAVALANKNARIAWALLTQGGHYDSQYGMRIGEGMRVSEGSWPAGADRLIHRPGPVVTDRLACGQRTSGQPKGGGPVAHR